MKKCAFQSNLKTCEILDAVLNAGKPRIRLSSENRTVTSTAVENTPEPRVNQLAAGDVSRFWLTHYSQITATQNRHMFSEPLDFRLGETSVTVGAELVPAQQPRHGE